MEDIAGRFLTARWIHLAMLNYEVEPAVLASRVPAGTELDRWNGRTFVSIVGFHFLDTRVLGLPIPGHRNFDEVNLRFYVRRAAPEGMRRGVVFVREIVPRRVTAFVANRVYRERYVALPMRSKECVSESEGGAVSYAWRFGGHWNRLSLAVAGEPRFPDDDSEEAFITEHYWGYAGRPGRATTEYRVEHPRWRVWRATDASLDCDVAGFYGPEFAAPLAAPPSSAFLADGSEVAVRLGRRIG
jgi:uncharacterized protein YqjF (DUF2071 family)